MAIRIAPHSSVFLCNRHPSCSSLGVSSELFIVCYYIINISLPLENKTGVQSGDQILCQKLIDGLRNLNSNEPEKKGVIME